MFNIKLDYKIDKTFPNVSDSEIGKHSIELTNLDLFSANKDNSYKCTSLTSVDLNGTVTLDLKNYQAEPFIKDPKTNDFDTG